MHLKSLNLKGFKSFADRTVMKFEPGLAAIVGPNGSGKSNISDAVLWVLGERNAKNLRGQSMEDVIFAGSSARKPVSVAEVELVLDNSDNTLPVEFNEVSIGRRMYRSGESEYLINGTVVRRMDVLDILHDSGLGTGTNSIISQGNLDSVLSSKPEDRRALIEEAAGILKHKERKMKSERKLAQMDNHLARVNDITAEVERQMKPLERKAKRALAYEELSGELAELKLQVSVDDLRLLQKKWDETIEHEEQLKSTSAELRNALKQAEEHLDVLQNKLDQRGLDESEINTQYRSTHMIQERLNSNIMLLHEKKRNALSQLERVTRELEENRAKNSQAQKELEKVVAQFEEVSKAFKDAKNSLERLEASYNARVGERNELRRTLDTLNSTQRGYVHKIESIQAMQQALKDNLSEKRARASVLTSHIADSEKRFIEAEKQTVASESLVADLSVQLETAQNIEKQSREQLNTTIVARDASRKEVDESRNAYVQVSSERSALEEHERVAKTLNQAYSWVFDNKDKVGTYKELTHVLKVPAKYEAIVEALLGDDINSVILSDAEQARMAINLVLNADVVGKMSFLHKPSIADTKKLDYICLYDCIEVEEGYEPIAKSLFATTYVFETFDQTMDAYCASPGSAVFASLDGICIDKTGKISLVRTTQAQREQSFLARRRHLEALIAKEKLLKSAYEKAQENNAQLENNLRAYQTQALKNSEAVALLRGQYNSAVSDNNKNKQAFTLLKTEYEALLAEQKENQEFLDKAQPDSDELQKDLLKFEQLLSQNKEEISELSAKLSPIQREIVQMSEKLSDLRLENARLSERYAYSERMVQTRKLEIASVESSDKLALETQKVASLVAKRVDPLLHTLGSLTSSVSLSVARLEKLSQEEQQEARNLHQELAQATKRSREAHDAFDELTSKLSEVRIEKGRLEIQVESAINVIVEDCETPLETALALDVLINREETVSEVERLERRIKNMGAINPDAAKEYEEVKERFTYLSAQLEDMKLARASLSRIVKVIDERMKDDFINTFNQVNANFAEIFGILFPGGQAHLSLVDPDDLENTGVDVNAQPVGKRIKKMSLLSGGEKSMTAMALLFAVYRIRQTPFYILDEVEAALDDSNLRRLLGYLNTIRDDTQFIMITHQRRTMESADILYGVSMQSDGVTKVLSQKLEADKKRG